MQPETIGGLMTLAQLEMVIEKFKHDWDAADPPRPPGVFRSADIGKLAGALAKAQGAFDSIGRTREVIVSMKTGGSYKFAYAPLDEVLRAVRPALSANGLALVQTIADGEGGKRTMTTTVLHESGEFISSTTTLPGQASTAQEFGSQITYMRRYAIVTILGVVAEEDDDGNGADGNEAQGRDRQPQRREQTPPKAAGGAAHTQGSQPPPSNGSHATNQNGSPPAPGQSDVDKQALRINNLCLTKPNPADPSKGGLGWDKGFAVGWLKARFAKASTSHMTKQQKDDAEKLLGTLLLDGDDAYNALVAMLSAQGRVLGDGEVANDAG